MNGESEVGTLVALKDVRKHFPPAGGVPWSRHRRPIRAVDGISLEIRDHETLSLVGESGCGKTTTARLILLLERPTAGSITFRNRQVASLKGQALREYRASVQAVFQDPWSSLNPRLRGRAIVGEPLVINHHLRGAPLQERIDELLAAVGLNPAVADYFPHELSGGMKQRLAIARALGLGPSLVVLDEPVSALDVSIRAQIMNLLKDLQERFGMSYLLIAHNLATVRYLSHRMAVMYVGKIVEFGEAEAVFSTPLHPYTKALIGGTSVRGSMPLSHRAKHRIMVRRAAQVAGPAAPNVRRHRRNSAVVRWSAWLCSAKATNRLRTRAEVPRSKPRLRRTAR